MFLEETVNIDEWQQKTWLPEQAYVRGLRPFANIYDEHVFDDQLSSRQALIIRLLALHSIAHQLVTLGILQLNIVDNIQVYGTITTGITRLSTV